MTSYRAVSWLPPLVERALRLAQAAAFTESCTHEVGPTTCSGSTRTSLRLCTPERLETVKPSHVARGGRLIRPPLESLKTHVVPLGRTALELVRQEDRLGHLAHRLAVVHADPAHALEGFRLAQAVHLHQDALGTLDQLARLERLL